MAKINYKRVGNTPLLYKFLTVTIVLPFVALVLTVVGATLLLPFFIFVNSL